MVNEGTKFQIFSHRFLQGLTILFFIITFYNVFTFVRNNYGFNGTIMYDLALISLFLLLVPLIVNHVLKNKTLFIVFLVLIAFVTRLVWVLNVNTPIISDFSVMYQGAIDASKGNFQFTDTPYFITWVYQLGFTMYQAVIIKLFGEGPFILKLLNIIYSVGTTVLVYKISAKIFNETTGRIAGIIYAAFIPSIVMSSVLTNQHLATFLFYLGFYLLILNEESKRPLWIYSAVLIALGDIIRPLGSLILLAIGIYLFLTQFLGADKQRKLNTIKKVAGILVTYFLIHFFISQLFIAMDITKYPLSNRDPQWKFVLGFNHESGGWYSNEDAEFVGQYPVGDEREKAETELINERIADKQKLLKLFWAKLGSMWSGFDGALEWSLGHAERIPIINNLFKLERLMYLVMIFFGIISLVKIMINKFSRKELALVFLLILGYVAVHLLIEIQTRYRYFIMPCFIILQSYGIFILFELIKGSLKKVIKKA
ncbi:glycosyltransferase family 39 protein [Bacillus marasmi]|uniref:glycosyltransferase family 39 protein n=1 Tax=Bacillus marasmi TaxID=1926279 RepID=UPI001FE9C5E3|nr:glycosyltransferase family 39 protein [Bacillus marasmi]